MIVEENDGKARNRMIGVQRVDLSVKTRPFQSRTEADICSLCSYPRDIGFNIFNSRRTPLTERSFRPSVREPYIGGAFS